MHTLEKEVKKALSAVLSLSQQTKIDLSMITSELNEQLNSLKTAKLDKKALSNIAYNARLAIPRGQFLVKLTLKGRLFQCSQQLQRCKTLSKFLKADRSLFGYISGINRKIQEALINLDKDLSKCTKVLEQVQHELIVTEDKLSTLGRANNNLIWIVIPEDRNELIDFGARSLQEALLRKGYSAIIANSRDCLINHVVISQLLPENIQYSKKDFPKIKQSITNESFVLRKIQQTNKFVVTISSKTPTGVMYGCIGLIDQLVSRNLEEIDEVTSTPKMRLRGTGFLIPVEGKDKIGHQTAIFPTIHSEWFYDAEMWQRLFTRMAYSRMNWLIMYHLHPFPYITRLDCFPEGRLSSMEFLAKNMAMLHYIISEGKKFGVNIAITHWNIWLPDSFCDAHNIPRGSHPRTDLTEEFTREAEKELLRTYPDLAGLGAAPSEHLQGNGGLWLENTLAAAAKQICAETGKAITLFPRTWGLGAAQLKEGLMPYNGEIWVSTKFNIEHLDITTYPGIEVKNAVDVGGVSTYSGIGPSNLFPHSFGSPEFIHQCCCHLAEAGVEGIMIQPLPVESWPYTLDKEHRHLRYGFDRNWIWFEAFGKFSWNPKVNFDRQYWILRLTERFGSKEAATYIYQALKLSSKILPAVVSEFWICACNLYRPQINGYAEGTETGTASGWMKPRWIDLRELTYAPARVSPLFWGKGAVVTSISDYVVHLLHGKSLTEKFTPQQIQERLTTWCIEAENQIGLSTQFVIRNKIEFNSIRKDIKALYHTGLFWRERIGAAVNLELYNVTSKKFYLDMAKEFANKAMKQYQLMINSVTKHYELSTLVDGLVGYMGFSSANFSRHLTDELLPQGQEEVKNLHRTFIPVNGGAKAFFLGSMGTLRLRRALENKISQSFSSYLLPTNFSKCRLLVVDSNMNIASFKERAKEILNWIKAGGCLVLWRINSRSGVMADFFPYPLKFSNDGTYSFTFADLEHPLIGKFKGQKIKSTNIMSIGSNAVKECAPEWKILCKSEVGAYLLESSYGKGKIVIMQWNTPFSNSFRYCQELARNILNWIGSVKKKK
ncbi:hypothetical protein KAW08_01060 [bacterium]|nr:hypothetical protein [bacterium]